MTVLVRTPVRFKADGVTCDEAARKIPCFYLARFPSPHPAGVGLGLDPRVEAAAGSTRNATDFERCGVEAIDPRAPP